MKSFKEMWELAKLSGETLENLAEKYYETMKERVLSEEIQAVLDIIAEINGYAQYLTEKKAETSDIHKINKTIKNHKHDQINGQVLLPMEIDC